MCEKQLCNVKISELPIPHQTSQQLDQLALFINTNQNVLNRPLVGKPVMESKVQESNCLLGTGKGASSIARSALISLACYQI